MSGVPKDNDGFGALWNLVIEQARLRMVTEKPNETAAFLQRIRSIEDGPRLARELAIGTPYLKAIEAGVACREAIFRISDAYRITEQMDHGHAVADGIESMIMDSCRVYLPAYIDAVRKFIEAALGQLLPEDADTRRRREEVGKYSAAAKKVLSNGRETVAHADTAFIAGIEEEGIWAPLILAGGVTEESLTEMFKQSLATNHQRFRWRFEQILKVAVMALAEGEAQMLATARLIQRKLAKPAG